MSIRLQPASTADVAAIVDLAVRRTRHTEPFAVSTMFAPTNVLEVATTAWDGDRLVGFGGVAGRVGAPGHQRTVRVYVAREAEGRGLGGSLFRTCLEAAPAKTTELWTGVFDDDDRSLEIARHWDLATVQLTIRSTLRLTGAAAAEPRPPAGVTVELRHDLDLDAADAVGFDHLLAVCQTNPEAASHHAFTRAELAHWVDPGEQLLLGIARVDGVPAAFCLTIVEAATGQGTVAYTGVDPAYRERGLGRLVKQHGQHAAALHGIRALSTDNAEENLGIRQVNARMGWQRSHGTYRLRRVV